MKYVRLDNNIVVEIIPEINPALPGFPIEERYPAAYVAQLITVQNDVEVGSNWTYDDQTVTFSPPSLPEEENVTPEETSESIL